VEYEIGMVKTSEEDLNELQCHLRRGCGKVCKAGHRKVRGRRPPVIVMTGNLSSMI
jgi:hypothetical protein